jgi:spore coat protein JB
MEKRLSMLKEIQALEFFAIELNLFLDTHPGDRAALRDFYAIREKTL